MLTTGFDGSLRAIDLAGGNVRWEAPSAETRFLGVTDGEHVAATRCPGEDDCEVQSLSLRDGTVRWSAPEFGGELMGVPLTEAQPAGNLPLWPASFAIVRNGREWEARELASGRVLATGDAESGYTGMLGDVLLRVTGEGAVTATDVRSGRELWRRTEMPGPVISPRFTAGVIAMPEGALLLAGSDVTLEHLSLGRRLRLADARTGKVTEYPLDLPPGLTQVISTNRPGPRAPAVLQTGSDGESVVVVDGHRYEGERIRVLAVTAQQAGTMSNQRAVWGLGRKRVVEVYDRKSGERSVRVAGEPLGLASRGERLVILEGDPDDPAEHVVAAP